MKRVLLVCTVTALAAAGPACAATTVIDFTTLPNGTVVSSQFPGVTFSLSGGPGPGGSPIASSVWSGTVELGNSTSGNYPTAAFLTLAFAQNVSQLSFTYSNYGTAYIGRGASYYSAYDSLGALVSSGFLGSTDGFPLIQVGGSGISSLVLSNNTQGTDSWMFGIRQLSFETAAVAPVPEPRTWAMLLVGTAMIGGVMRRRASVSFA